MFQSTVSQINTQTVENPGRKFVPIDFRGKYKRLQLAEQQREKAKLVIQKISIYVAEKKKIKGQVLNAILENLV